MKTRKEAINDAMKTTLNIFLVVIIIVTIFSGINLFKSFSNANSQAKSNNFKSNMELLNKLVEKRKESSLTKGEERLLEEILAGTHKTNLNIDEVFTKRIKVNLIMLGSSVVLTIIILLFLNALSKPEKIDTSQEQYEKKNED